MTDVSLIGNTHLKLKFLMVEIDYNSAEEVFILYLQNVSSQLFSWDICDSTTSDFAWPVSVVMNQDKTYVDYGFYKTIQTSIHCPKI